VTQGGRRRAIDAIVSHGWEGPAVPYARAQMTGQATVIYVAYGVSSIDTSWVDPKAPMIIVHNDRRLPPGSVSHANVHHIIAARNVGFGAAVNMALDTVTSSRLIICNPDTLLTGAHYTALSAGSADEAVTIPLSDERGQATWVVLPYPRALEVLAMAYRLGRIMGRDTRLRRIASRVRRTEHGSNASYLGVRSGSWPLQSHWASGAALSLDTARLRAVGGFDPGYFLYMEDVDLCRRLADRFPSMRVRVADCEPGRHLVGGSATGATRASIELHRLRSVQRFCSRERGARWRVVRALTGPRQLWLVTRARRPWQRRKQL
jgi:GT2 family glycosyltransferase